MTFEPPVVVLAEGLEGLRASAWLASQGVAVRHLCVGPIPAPDTEPLLAGERGRLEPFLGPLRATDTRPGLHLHAGFVPVPGRRRDVAQLAGLGPFGLVREWWSGERRLPRDLGSWGRQTFGPTAWDVLVAPLVEARLGPDVDGLHRGLGPLLASRPDGPWWVPEIGGEACVARWTRAVRAADGEVLDDVGVAGLEIEHGRIVAVLTDHGREHAGTLVSDLGPERLGPWLPQVALDTLPACADLVEVAFGSRGGSLPPVVYTRASRVLAAHDRIRVTLVGDGFTSWADEPLAERATVAAAGLGEGPPLAVVRRPRQVPRPAPSTEGAAYRWLARLALLGVLPVGPRALLVPMGLRDEVDTTVAVLDRVPPVEVRGGRLGLVPSRPWVLAQ
jgi:hypothetical protein